MKTIYLMLFLLFVLTLITGCEPQIVEKTKYYCPEEDVYVDEPNRCGNMPMWEVCKLKGWAYDSAANVCIRATPSISR